MSIEEIKNKLIVLAKDRKALAMLAGIVLVLLVLNIIFNRPNSDFSERSNNPLFNTKNEEETVIPRVQNQEQSTEANQKYYIPTDYDLKVTDPEFEIEYDKINNSYKIYLISGVYPKNLERAESAFLEKMGFSESTACQLNVSVMVPIFMSERAPTRLSFCR